MFVLQEVLDVRPRRKCRLSLYKIATRVRNCRVWPTGAVIAPDCTIILACRTQIMFRSHCPAINFAPQIQPVTCLLRGIPPLLALGDFLRAYGEINEAPFLKDIFQKQKQKYPLWYGAGDPTARLLYFACRTPFACCAQLRGTGCVLRLWCTVYSTCTSRAEHRDRTSRAYGHRLRASCVVYRLQNCVRNCTWRAKHRLRT